MNENINICILDFQKEDIDKVNLRGFKTYNGSVGTKVNIPHIGSNSSKFCLLNSDTPSNMHEYSILIINMINNNNIPYSDVDHRREKVSTSDEMKLKVSYPTNLFDPRPFSFHLLEDEISEFSQKKGLLIMFADEEYEVSYNPVRFKAGGYYENQAPIKLSNYSFWPEAPLKTAKNGRQSKIVVEGGELRKLLMDFTELEYHQTFNINQIWSSHEGKHIQDPNYVALIENQSNEVISFAYLSEKTSLFIFPDIKEKGEFTGRFLTEIAPQIIPELFSEKNNSSWLNNQLYWLPGHEKLLNSKDEEIKRHQNELETIESNIEINKAKYEFLHNLISETGNKLVDAVVEILTYIGFENIKKIDETKDDGVLEEDIQIEIDGKLLVIEVKGIGGTSKDSECNQISKVRLRRMKERGSTEVYGLYIVNHERHKPPHLRNNPPFNDIQIQDALNDDRGLLTTWDLYKLYFDIENGILSKEDVKAAFLDYGIVSFRKHLKRIAKVDKTFLDNQVASIQLEGTELKKNQFIISEKNGLLKKHRILSIEQNKIKLEKVETGATGLELDSKIEKNSIIYIKNGEAL